MPQTVVVLGARNLGGAIIDHFLALGWNAAGVAWSEETLDRVRTAGALALQADASNPQTLASALERARRELGRAGVTVGPARRWSTRPAFVVARVLGDYTRPALRGEEGSRGSDGRPRTPPRVHRLRTWRAAGRSPSARSSPALVCGRASSVRARAWLPVSDSGSELVVGGRVVLGRGHVGRDRLGGARRADDRLPHGAAAISESKATDMVLMASGC